MLTQDELNAMWQTYTRRIHNEGEPELITTDYYAALACLGGIPITGRGELPIEEARQLIEQLKQGGCAVLDDRGL